MKKEIVSFLKGDAEIITKRLEEEMLKDSEALNYEKALELKNMLEDIKITLNKQKIDLNKNYYFDLINYYKDKKITLLRKVILCIGEL